MSRVSISKKVALNFIRAARLGLSPDPWALEELRRALKPKATTASPDCQWCGHPILSEPCGASHRMRQRLALAKAKKQGRR